MSDAEIVAGKVKVRLFDRGNELLLYPAWIDEEKDKVVGFSTGNNYFLLKNFESHEIIPLTVQEQLMRLPNRTMFIYAGDDREMYLKINDESYFNEYGMNIVSPGDFDEDFQIEVVYKP